MLLLRAMVGNHRSLSRLWMALASVSLLLSGALALLITSAKMPGIKSLVQEVDFVRWCLVEHVNLATLVWFTAVPVGLFHLYHLAEVDRKTEQSRTLSVLGWGVAGVGILLMLSAVPTPGVEAVLANYIPMVDHPRYAAGLIAYLGGVAVSFASRRLFWPSETRDVPGLPGLAESGFGIMVGATFFFASLLTLAMAYMGLAAIGGLETKTYYEIGMWGGGHLLQHSSATFLIVSWVVLLSNVFEKAIFTRRELFSVFAWMGLPLFVLPIVLQFGVTDREYREGFTLFMRWGIFPPVVFFWIWTALRWGKLFRKAATDYRVSAFVLSAALIAMGFIFGAFINGPDLRVPGHYHSTIGAVTVAFMAIAYKVLASDAAEVSKWMNRSIWAYGVGQILFSAGMFIAGSYGIGRKTYGAEHQFTHWGQYVGMGGMAVGGLAAFLGGAFFAIAIIPPLRRLARSSHAPKHGNSLELGSRLS